MDCFYSREIFNKWQAQRWWAENQDRVIELYNVQRFSHYGVPLPTPPRLEDEVHFSEVSYVMNGYNHNHLIGLTCHFVEILFSLVQLLVH